MDFWKKFPETPVCNRRMADLKVKPGGKQIDQTGKLFEELALPVLDRLYQLACRFERDPQKAEDLLQEALLTGFRKFRQLKNPNAFHAWTSRILRHTFLNQQGRKIQDVRLDDGLTAEQTRPVEHVGPYEPERRLLAWRLSRELKAAMNQLPREQRAAILLVDVQGFSYAETAYVLDAAPGTVASRLARGRAALRHTLGHLARERGWAES